MPRSSHAVQGSFHVRIIREQRRRGIAKTMATKKNSDAAALVHSSPTWRDIVRKGVLVLDWLWSSLPPLTFGLSSHGRPGRTVEYQPTGSLTPKTLVWHLATSPKF
jgi:hypothetical protein